MCSAKVPSSWPKGPRPGAPFASASASSVVTVATEPASAGTVAETPFRLGRQMAIRNSVEALDQKKGRPASGPFAEIQTRLLHPR